MCVFSYYFIYCLFVDIQYGRWVYYCFNTMTTVGYGDFAAATTLGQVIVSPMMATGQSSLPLPSSLHSSLTPSLTPSLAPSLTP
jgi:hypothetical protein